MWSDKWTKRAKEAGYPARSVYKLKEADHKFKFIKPGSKVLELGASPGSWTKYVLERIGKDGLIVAVDLNDIIIPKDSRLVFIKSDVFDLDLDGLKKIAGGYFNILLSDMAPSTTGIHFVDQEASFNLAKKALEIARELLISGGSFFIKFFEGEGSRDLIGIAKDFAVIKLFRPTATRKSSSEIYLFGTVK